ncbi:MAG: hypothetical protein RSA50_07460, partial [Mucinivorans sp.]
MSNITLSLEQRLLQRLSPQQIQGIKLLELPTMALESRIKEEMEENPVLEEKELSAEQIADIHEQSNGWPGAINQVARDSMIEAMIASRSAVKR